MGKRKPTNYRSECPSCSRRANNKLTDIDNVRRCLSCGALFGEVSADEVGLIVKEQMHPDIARVRSDDLLYFCLDVQVDDKTRHIEGWMDAPTKLVVQRLSASGRG